ncbi:MAG: tRNA (guanosine(46)-N7)-methyltransferase TrmB [Marinirhabdus sp.]
MDSLYPKIKIGDTPAKGLEDFSELWLEIGFGGSEHLIWQAQNNPDVAVLGAEPFLNGVAKAVASVDEHGLNNVRLHQGDARNIMDTMADGSLSCLFVLFPDPWPKARHNKRRIITPDFLCEVHRVLKPGGTAILQVPQDKLREVTFEDPTITDKEQRTKIFGQYDHVRVYGMDYFNTLRSVGFNVEAVDYTNTMTDSEIDRFRLAKGELLPVCKKLVVQ